MFFADMNNVFISFFSEINKVRVSLFHLNTNKETMSLPEPVGAVVTLSEKVFVPVKEYPEVRIIFIFSTFLSLSEWKCLVSVSYWKKYFKNVAIWC